MVQVTLIALILMSPSLMVLAQNPYCKFGKDHTMCKYSPKPCGKTEANCQRGGISEEDLVIILTMHNQLRSTVAKGDLAGQPSGSNIREMKYSDELEDIAQRWADQTNFTHDTNRITADFNHVGQNAALTRSKKSSGAAMFFNRIIGIWFNGATGFNPANISPFKFTAAHGLYTQLLWAETDRVGCGYAFFKKGPWYSKMYFCNYGISGNTEGAAMYKKGKPATECLKGPSVKYPALCAS